uniref:FCS-type domain-containing protein n=1 Tax=Anser cygnoides TaxID=8845 RepID=A0A8B9ESJ7_ANSCY
MTSGNGSSASTVAGAAPHNGENKPPQAIVKPQILTHVIEGFVIQEGAEPFPVGRSSLLVGNLKKKYAQELLAEKLPQQDNTTTTDSEMEEPYMQGVPPRPPESKEEGNPPKLKCELCGRVDFAYKFKRSKRFCSMACAKRYNVGCTKRVGLFHPDRSKLQKPGGPPHGRRRTCKVPTLSKDTKKQTPVSLPTGSVPLSVTASLQLNHSQEDSSRCPPSRPARPPRAGARATATSSCATWSCLTCTCGTWRASGTASCPASPASGMWRTSMSSSARCRAARRSRRSSGRRRSTGRRCCC